MKNFLMSGIALTCVLSPAVGHAQAEPQPTPPASAAPQVDLQDQPTGLEDIVVTAQRRAENLQKVAVAVSAVGNAEILSAGVTDTQGLSRLVPSLQVQPAGGGAVSFYLRGVGTLQQNAFGENAIAFNFGGVYLARPSAPVGAFYDLERVEVVKGPQGTLYGRNATGGAINVLPSRPRLGVLGGDVTLEAANHDALKGQAAVNLPLGETAALRIAGQVIDRSGYLSDGYDDESGEAARVSLLYQPNDVWSALIVADYFHQGGNGVGSVLVPSAYIPNAPAIEDRIGGSDPRSVAALTQWAAALPAPPFCPGGFIASGCVAPPRSDGYNDSTFWGVSATIEARLDLGTLTIIPAYRRSEPDFRFYSAGFLGEISEVDEQTSLEVRFASPDDQRLRYVVGAYYFDEDQDAQNYFYQGTLSTTRFTPQLSTQSQAVFGQGTFSVTDAFRIVAGARYTHEEKSQSTALASGGLPGPVSPGLGVAFPGSLEFSQTTWKIGAEWDVAPQSLLYAHIGTGFKAGGFFVASPPNNTFEPETITAYTIGSKNRFLDNRLQLNAEAFYWDYADQQISFVGGITTPSGVIAPGGTTVNAGQATMYGAEIDLRFAATPRDMISANIQYLKAEYDELVYDALSASGGPIRSGCASTDLGRANPGVPQNVSRLFRIDCSGKQAINSPDWTANFAYEHTFDVGRGFELVAGARTRIEAGRFLAIEYLPEIYQDGFTSSDAFLTLEAPDDRWSVTAFVNNIEDDTVLAGAFVRPVLQTVYANLRPPRTYGVRLTARF